MKLGAQLYSLRQATQTAEGIRETFRRVKEMGYEVVQVSGVPFADNGAVTPTHLRAISEEFNLPITCTHSPLDRIIGDTDKLIAEHKLFGCPVIGIGSMPKENRGSIEGVRAFIEATREAEKKIRDAGMRLTYHNHAFEFDDLGGTDAYELLLAESAFDFIHDTYWSTFAGRDPLDYIARLAGRMSNIHFKDLSPAEGHPICACGQGTIDFTPIIAACRKAGVLYAQVEQDNAPTFDDPFGQMALSASHLIPLMK